MSLVIERMKMKTNWGGVCEEGRWLLWGVLGEVT